MKAWVKEKPEPGIAMRDIPIPVVGPGEVLIQMRACSIAGSEMGRYRWEANYQRGGPKDMSGRLPRILGKELAGEVVAVGDGVEASRLRQRVVINDIVGCRRCDYCRQGMYNLCPKRETIGVDRDGTLAEYCVVPAENATVLPDTLSFEVGAAFHPFALAAHALEVANTKAGQTIGIWGAGGIGLSLLMNAQIAGADVAFVVGRGKPRLEVAHRLGAQRVVSIRDGIVDRYLKDELGQNSIDAIFETSGSPDIFAVAPFLLRPGGKIVLIGNFCGPVTLDLVTPRRKEIDIVSVRSFTVDSWNRALRLIGKAPMAQVIGPVLPLSQGEEAFRMSLAGTAIKAIMVPDN